jgi:hypothetical protein
LDLKNTPINAIVSAVVSAVVSGLASQYLFNEKVKEVHDKQTIYTIRFTKEDPQTEPPARQLMTIQISNVGRLPVDDVTISLRPSASGADWSEQLKVDPPLPFTTEHQTNTFFLKFTRKLGPGSEVKVDFPVTRPIPSAWVMTEVGLALLISEPHQREEAKRETPQIPGDQP